MKTFNTLLAMVMFFSVYELFPSTLDDNTQNRDFIRRILDMFGDNSSMHNCYGLGQEQCKYDGYRKEGELIMNKEQTIFDLNQNKHSNK